MGNYNRVLCSVFDLCLFSSQILFKIVPFPDSSKSQKTFHSLQCSDHQKESKAFIKRVFEILTVAAGAWDWLVKTGKLMNCVRMLPECEVVQTRSVARGRMLELRARWKVLMFECPR